MTDFNELPLAEKIKQAQAGDILVTDRGAKLPIIDAYNNGQFDCRIDSSTSMRISQHYITDIIRPTARKVPEVVGILRHYATEISCEDSLTQVFLALADHFERGTP